LENVIFLDQIQKEELPEYYAANDIILVTLRNLPLFKCVIPSKIFEIMAMAKPILMSVDGESKSVVVNEAKAGIAVVPENAEDMANHISKIYNNNELLHNLGMNGRTFVENYFDRNKLADKYLELIQDILNH